MAAKFTNSSEESSMGSAVYFSSRVFTENLHGREKGQGIRGRGAGASRGTRQGSCWEGAGQGSKETGMKG